MQTLVLALHFQMVLQNCHLMDGMVLLLSILLIGLCICFSLKKSSLCKILHLVSCCLKWITFFLSCFFVYIASIFVNINKKLLYALTLRTYLNQFMLNPNGNISSFIIQCHLYLFDILTGTVEFSNTCCGSNGHKWSWRNYGHL